MHSRPRPDRQRGAAHLAITLALMSAMTILAAAAASSALRGLRFDQAAIAATRARLAADAGIAFGRLWLRTNEPRWFPAGPDTEVASPAAGVPPPGGNRSAYAINLGFRRHPGSPDLIQLRVHARAHLGAGGVARSVVWVRRLPALTVAARQAPTLVTGRGRRDLWQDLFRISRKRFARLAAGDAAKPPGARRHWLVQASDLMGGRWHRSLGSAEAPVILVFPRALGCPRIGPGVRLTGLVFIDADCRGRSLGDDFAVTGTLAVAGEPGQLGPAVRLHPLTDPGLEPAEVRWPIVDVIMLPGTWRDF